MAVGRVMVNVCEKKVFYQKPSPGLNSLHSNLNSYFCAQNGFAILRVLEYNHTKIID